MEGRGKGRVNKNNVIIYEKSTDKTNIQTLFVNKKFINIKRNKNMAWYPSWKKVRK